jgi:hypothetical protein
LIAVFSHSHVHSENCGHERVPHDDHFDFLVGDELHHSHDNHCDSHGRLTRRHIKQSPSSEETQPLNSEWK